MDKIWLCTIVNWLPITERPHSNNIQTDTQMREAIKELYV
jgi:hypothetical protein